KNTGAGIVRWKKASNKFVHCPSKIMMLTKVTVGSCREGLMKSNERVRPGVPYIATEQTRRLVAGCHKRSVLKRTAEHTFLWIDRTLLGVTGGIEELKGIARNVAEEIQTLRIRRTASQDVDAQEPPDQLELIASSVVVVSVAWSFGVSFH